jgi:DNA-binding transcriptional MocR family regulator
VPWSAREQEVADRAGGWWRIDGQQLPTVRELATDMGVHHNTVAEAYRLLALEGWPATSP